MKIYNISQFEKLKINPINANEFDKIGTYEQLYIFVPIGTYMPEQYISNDISHTNTKNGYVIYVLNEKELRDILIKFEENKNEDAYKIMLYNSYYYKCPKHTDKQKLLDYISDIYYTRYDPSVFGPEVEYMSDHASSNAEVNRKHAIYKELGLNEYLF